MTSLKKLNVQRTRMLLLYSLFSWCGGLCCISGSDYDVRNKEIFDEAKNNSFISFTTTPIDFTGPTSIATLRTTIDALAAAGIQTSDTDIADVTIEGVVTMPSSYGVGIGTGTGTNAGCGTAVVDQSSFIIQDATAGILVLYGQERPSQNTADSSSMRYITNARNPKMAVFGDRIRMTATRALRWGGATGQIPVITDFSNVEVVSSRNSVPYATQVTALSRATDLFRVRRFEGYVITEPKYVECASTRSFQFNFQRGYLGRLCVGATSVSDAASCTGAKVPIKFQMSLYLGAGTLSGFDTGDMFSYTISKDAKVRITGPIFAPQFDVADNNLGSNDEGNLAVMLGQRLQVETIK